MGFLVVIFINYNTKRLIYQRFHENDLSESKIWTTDHKKEI